MKGSRSLIGKTIVDVVQVWKPTLPVNVDHFALVLDDGRRIRVVPNDKKET